MGQFWLHDLDEVLAPGVGHGIVELVPVQGHETRSNKNGGLSSINGILKHHTASPASWNWDRDIEYIAFTNQYAPSPICQIYHDRTGRVAIVADGQANHGGLGGAYKPGGPLYVSVDQANQVLIGNEMGNAGTGEVWPWKQIVASITTDALICRAERFDSGHVFAHKEYCGPGTTQPGRKIDPLGPWENHPQQYWPDGTSWGAMQGNIDIYRSLVAKKIAELSQEINIMEGFIPYQGNPRILDSRGTPDNFDAYKMKAGVPVTVTVPGGAGMSRAVVNLTAVHGEGAGFFTAWANGSKPNSSELNWQNQQAIANEVTIALAPDGTFQLYPNVRVHVVVDLKGYFQQM